MAVRKKGLPLLRDFSSFGWRGNNTQLLHHAEIVWVEPGLRDPGVNHAVENHPLLRDQFAGGGDAEQLTLVGALRRPAGGSFISFGDRIVNAERQIGGWPGPCGQALMEH